MPNFQVPKPITPDPRARPVVGAQQVLDAGGAYTYGGRGRLTRDQEIAGVPETEDMFSMPLDGGAELQRRRNAIVPTRPNGPGSGGINLQSALSGLGFTDPMPNITAPPHVARSTGATAQEESLARDSAFARGKETAGNTARSAMNGLTEELSRRGLTGGGYEAGGIGQTLARAADGIGDVSRDQAVSEAANKTHIADTEYSGDLAQRGQDIGVGEANASLAMSRKQQQLQALNTLLSHSGLLSF